MAKSKRKGLVEEAFNPEKILKEGIKLANHINGINIDGLSVSSEKAKIIDQGCYIPMEYNDINIEFRYQYNNVLNQKSINFTYNKNESYSKNFNSYSDLAHVKTELCDNFFNQYKKN